MPVGTLDPSIHFNPKAGGKGAPGGGSSGTGTGTPLPNIAMFTHELHVSAQCFGMICATTDDLVFFPIHFAGIPTTLDVRVGSTVQATVETYPAMSTSLNVQIRPSSVAVRLNEAAPGAAIFPVTIPGNAPSLPFRVTGMISTTLDLFVEAPGTQLGVISVVVNP